MNELRHAAKLHTAQPKGIYHVLQGLRHSRVCFLLGDESIKRGAGLDPTKGNGRERRGITISS